MVRRKGKRRKKPAQSIPVARLAAGALAGYYFGLGGRSGEEALKAGDYGQFLEEISENWTKSSTNQYVGNLAPLVLSILASKVMGRSNPGVTLGKYRIKVF